MVNKHIIGMLSFKFSAALVLFLFSLGLSVCNGVNPTYTAHSCSNTTNFTVNSIYQDNLNLLLSSLSSNASGINSGFYNASAGQNPNTVRGLFLCRGDVSVQVCQDCVTYATQDVTQRCPVGKVAIIFYDECMLRYSNDTIFSTLAETPRIIMYNSRNVTMGLDQFNVVLASALNDTATRATDSASGSKMFAVKKENFSTFQTVYNLMQCTPDLPRADCNVCLRGVIATLPNCCGGKQGATILTPSCNFRFELYPFYNESAVAVPSPPPPVLPPPPPRGPIILLACSIFFFCF